MKVWQCSVCKYIHRGNTPPEKCPVCGVPGSRFVEIDEASIPQRTPGTKKIAGGSKSTSPGKDRIQTSAASIKETGFKKIKSLLIKHHAHPVSVHTPNGLLPAAVILFFLAWLFHAPLLSKAALINLIFVIIALPFVIFTGVLEWKKKYQGALTIIFKLKILAASLTTISCIISLVWYMLDPEILSSPKSWVFILINIIMVAAAGVAGHIGGKLVFKD